MKKAILVAANPYRYYQVSPTRSIKELGDVEIHIQHRNLHGRVFWDMVPPGRLDTPWKHPEIDSGYFYISRDGVVRYRMSIVYIRRWKDIDIDLVENYIPEFRRSYLNHYRECMTYYAILIDDLHRMEHERKLNEFILLSTMKPVERVQNYAIIVDPEQQ